MYFHVSFFIKLFHRLIRLQLIALFLIVQLSFQMWTNQMQETLNSKKKGDAAFRYKDLKLAIDSYTQVSKLPGFKVADVFAFMYVLKDI